jgi:hypothetical protein
MRPTKLIFNEGEKPQVPHSTSVSRGNQGVGIATCSYCQQMGHRFSYCPFVDDRLRQLLREEVMNVHQLVILIIITILPNVLIPRIQAMNISISHIVIPISY